MRTYLLSFVVTAVLAAIFTPIVRHYAVRVGAVSNPGGRNVNARSVPRLGGIAIALAMTCTLAMLLHLESGVGLNVQQEPRFVIGLLCGALLVFGVGVLDDTRHVKALYKLLVQIAAACVAFGCGFRIDAVSMPFGGALSMGIFSLPITVIWIVGIVNAINLIDGLDGLAAGIVFFAGLTNFVVAFLGGNIFLAAVMATLLGAIVGFLFFNFNPARIFMGDSGSYFLGFVIGTTSIGYKASTTVALLVPMLALGVPIFDTLFTIVRRFIEKRPLFAPDRGHIHHRLMDMGLTHRRAVLTLYGVSIVFTVTSIAIAIGRSWEIGAAIAAASIVAIGLFRSVGYFDYLVRFNRQKERVRCADTQALLRSVPQTLAAFAAAQSEEQVWSSLHEMLRAAELANAEVRSEADAVIQTFAVEEEAPRDELVSARFPIGNDHVARGMVVFRWRAQENQVNPQTEILLQLAVDGLADALGRARSALGPCPPADPPSEKAPAAQPSAVPSGARA
jgi:UDP-GlcNAc:undecaprenyl-phosphate GlcNAc-1-phosphate transferase